MLFKIEDLFESSVVKRPSRIIKTPYVADVLVNGEEELAHSAALGCCGLSDKGATVMIAKIENKSKKEVKCAYRIYLAVVKERNEEIIVGIHPKLAEDIVEKSILSNYIPSLKNIKNLKREYKLFVEGKIDSRFDFAGIDDNNIPFILEVKNVPLADYEDMTNKERKKHNFDDRNINSKVAYFPDGYRKKTDDPVSPRALKHIQELTYIKKTSKTRAIICFVIQRTDVERFTASVIDMHYRNALIEAINCGVEVLTVVAKWTKNGCVNFIRSDLPIDLT